MTIKSALIGATAIAIALTSFDLRPSAAASDGVITAQNSATDFSAARKRRGHRVNPAVPLAAFGAIAGTIAGIAAANSRRDYYERHYYAPRYYEEPAYGYYGPPAYQYYEAPVYQRRGYYGGHPGYRGPNVNVPGATNYGQAAGQNGQAPPPVVSAPLGGSN